METLPNRIRKIREANSLTQTDVAFRMNISSASYGKIERKANLSSYDTLLRVAIAIGVSILFLIDTYNKKYEE